MCPIEGLFQAGLVKLPAPRKAGDDRVPGTDADASGVELAG